jgi:hypothetical protein
MVAEVRPGQQYPLNKAAVALANKLARIIWADGPNHAPYAICHMREASRGLICGDASLVDYRRATAMRRVRNGIADMQRTGPTESQLYLEPVAHPALTRRPPPGNDTWARTRQDPHGTDERGAETP